MQENLKLFEKTKDGIYFIEYPEEVTAKLIIDETTAIIRDFVETGVFKPGLMVLVDGSRVKIFDQSVLSIAIGKMKAHLDAKIAIIKMSKEYEDALNEFYKGNAPSPNVKQFDTEESAVKWLLDSSRDENKLIMTTA